MTAPLTSGDRLQRVLAAIVAIAGVGSVAPLLAWVYGLGGFAAWFWTQAVPGLVAIGAIGVWAARRGQRPAFAIAITAGVLGGVLGTILYDVCRLPFVAGGYRLFAPISSYGLLMLDAGHGDRLTETLGWAYNFANGTGFGIAYAMFGLGRRWWWAVPWALFLETMTVVTPYAGVYGLAGHPDIIAIAFGAHVFYGAGLGIVCERAGRWRTSGDAFLPPTWVLGGTAAVLVAFGQPWLSTAAVAPVDAAAPAPGSPSDAAAVDVRGGRFEPEWLRLGQGDCLRVVNRDTQAYRLSEPPGASELRASAAATYCFPTAGIKRVQLNATPYSGGFVIVDPSLRGKDMRP